LGPLFMKKNKIIIFDFDGVIVNTCQLSIEINKEIFEDLDFSEIQDWAEGNVFEKKFRDGYTGDHENYYYQHYSQRIKSLEPVLGMKGVFEEMKKMGYKLAVVSSSFSDVIEKFLKDNGLDEYFVEIMGKDVSPSKVAKFKMIFEKHNIKAKETLIVTDSVGDVKEAKEVKMKTIGVTWGIHEKERLERAKADFIAENVEEIIVGMKELLALN